MIGASAIGANAIGANAIDYDIKEEEK